MLCTVENLYSLPDSTRVFVGHDYQPAVATWHGRALSATRRPATFQLNGNTSAEVFVAFRRDRDATLNAPKLIYQSMLVNIEAGQFPAQESNGQRYLKIPLNIKTNRIK